jgi:hypothetical protein
MAERITVNFWRLRLEPLMVSRILSELLYISVVR